MNSELFWQLSNDFAIAMIEESTRFDFKYTCKLNDFDAMYCGF